MNYDSVLQSLDIVALDPTLGVNHDDICAAGALAIRQLRAERDALAALLREVREWIPYYRWIPDLRQRVDAAIVDKAP